MKKLKSSPAKNKHMDLEARVEIQLGLERRWTIKKIAETIGKDPTTVSKEIKKHIQEKNNINTEDEAEFVSYDNNGDIIPTPTCPLLLKSPYVCNGCDKKKRRCGYAKQFYYAKKAQIEYEVELVESRTGTALSKKEFWDMNKIVTEKLKQGQHLYHITQSNDLGVSQSSIYRFMKKGYLDATAFDFPRVVKFKARKSYVRNAIPKAVKAGRTYADFQAYLKTQEIWFWTEMDTVIGRIGGKVIMTFTFNTNSFMFGLLLENKTAIEAENKIKALKRKLQARGLKFSSVITTLLTDNGGEFANTRAFTHDLSGNEETKLFFCDPYQSSQKARIEKNHTLFRDIVPSGESFDDFTQETVDLIFSHVNSVKRKALNGKSAYEMFKFSFGEEIASLLGISEIPPGDVIQSPKLLK